MKILFLDVDGVLNLNDYMFNLLGPLQQCWILPSRLELLERVLQKTGCNIVLSSAWRIEGYEEGSMFDKHLRLACILDGNKERYDYISSKVVGRTSLDKNLTREEQILEYVKEFDIKKFAAVDDLMEGFPSKPNWLVLTNPRIGLDDYTTYSLIQKLK